MSKFKKDILGWIGTIRGDLQNHIRQYHTDIPPAVECEECGCLLKKGTAIQGELEVRRERKEHLDEVGLHFRGYWFTDEEYIYTPYYCKIHAPKEKK